MTALSDSERSKMSYKSSSHKNQEKGAPKWRHILLNDW